MEIFLNPNLAYLLLVAGGMLAILAVISPGTGMLEIGALFILLLAGWEVYLLEINWWALVLLLLGIIPFALAMRKAGRLRYLAIATLAFVVGSAFLFRGESWWQPAVHPLLAVIVSLLSGGYMWIATTKALEARLSSPRHDLERLIGAVGEAKTEIHTDGSVQVGGELWSARSEEPIPDGEEVRVLSREGFTLVVEAITGPGQKSQSQ